MTDLDLDGILHEEEDVNPSPGFVLSAMHAIRRDAAGPPAIEFPWTRALPAFVSLATMFITCFVLLVREAVAPQLIPSSSSVEVMLSVANTYGAGWIALALVLTLASVKLPSTFTHPKAR